MAGASALIYRVSEKCQFVGGDGDKIFRTVLLTDPGNFKTIRLTTPMPRVNWHIICATDSAHLSLPFLKRILIQFPKEQ